jgi:hypothetical protein
MGLPWPAFFDVRGALTSPPETEDGDEIVILPNHNTARTHQRPSAGVATLTFVALAASERELTEYLKSL